MAKQEDRSEDDYTPSQSHMRALSRFRQFWSNVSDVRISNRVYDHEPELLDSIIKGLDNAQPIKTELR